MSVCTSVTHWRCVKMTQATIMRSSLEDRPMTLVSLIKLHSKLPKAVSGEGVPNESGIGKIFIVPACDRQKDDQTDGRI